MSKWKVELFNQETYEVVNDCVDDEIFDTEEDAQAYIDDLHENLPEGLETLSLRGCPSSGTDYGYGDNDLVLRVEEIDD